MKKSARCNRELATISVKVNERNDDLLRPCDRLQGPVCGEKARSSGLKCHLDSAVWVLPGEINAMGNCAGRYEGLATLPGEVNVRFIALLSLFDSTQDRFRGEKPGQVA
jgi:hypothetical protein